MKIFGKALLILLPLVIIPLVLVVYMAILDVKNIGELGVVNAQKMGKTIASDSVSALNSLGEKIIQQKAEDVARQMAAYAKTNPNLTPDQLQKDPYFSSLAVQKVGEKGYTAAAELDTLLSRWHPSEKMVGISYFALEAKLPQLVGILKQANLTKKNVGGYYKWQEADGSIKDKYLYVAILPEAIGSTTLAVAATTYIDEFSQPVVAMQEKIASSIKSFSQDFLLFTKKMITKNIYVLFIVAVFGVFISFVIAKSITNPIVKLKQAADKVTQGDFNTQLPEVKGSDEIAELTASMEMLITAIKNKNK